MEDNLDLKNQESVQLITPLPPEFIAAGLQLVDKVVKQLSETELICYLFKNLTTGVSIRISVFSFGINTVSVEKNEKEFFEFNSYFKLLGKTEVIGRFFDLKANVEEAVKYL